MVTTKLLTEKNCDEAALLLKQGELVAFPTETVYGLGADALNNNAVLKIYEAKGRPRFNPLIAHVASIDEAFEWGMKNETAAALFKAFSPGALTIVLPLKNAKISDIALAGLETIGLRIPNHPLALKLLTNVQRPIFAPSANRSGHVSPTTAAHVHADLNGRIAAILDGGECMVGVESTIISCVNNPVLLREGGITREQIEAVIGKIEKTSSHKILAPGMMASHYAPLNKLTLNALEVSENESLLAFGDAIKGAKTTLNLSPTANLEEAAKNLFSYLRALDKVNLPIKAMPIPNQGLGAAINDRLKRAAS